MRSSLFCILFVLFAGRGLPAQDRPVAEFVSGVAGLAGGQPEVARDPTPEVMELLGRLCESDYACKVDLLSTGVEQFAKVHDYFPALLLANQLTDIASQQRDTTTVLKSLKNLSHLYNFLHDRRNTRLSFARQAELYEAAGDQGEAYYYRVMLLEGDVFYDDDPSRAIAEIETIYETARREGYEEAATKILTRLKYLYEEFGPYDRFAAAVKQLEEIVARIPANVASPYRLPALSGRGDIERRNGRYAAAAESYRTALRFVRAHDPEFGSPWSQSYLLLRLADLAWEQRRDRTAAAYLDTVFNLTTTYHLEDLLAQHYELRINMAEEARDYQSALAYTRDQRLFEQRIDSAEADFDLRRQNLQFAVNRLKAEKENQALALTLAKTRSRNYQLIGGLLATLVVGLLAAYYVQRRSRQQLAEQNDLIRQQADRLRRLDDTKSRFFANVSYELRTPLSLLTGPVDTLLRESGNLTERQRSLLTTAAKGGENLGFLINEILDLGRLEAQKVKPNPTPLGFYDFLEGHLQSFRTMAEQHRIRYDYTIAVSKRTWVAVDAELTRQVLSNLISNALKFTPPGQRVSVSAELSDGQFKLTVADTGPGIHPDDRARIFERFYQSDQPDASVSGGTGIGLALVREYAQLFGGRASVEETEGGGATFVVQFPVQLIDRPLPEPAPPPNFNGSTATTGKGPRLVIVEDNPQLRAYLQEELSPHYQVSGFPDGAEAWAYLSTFPGACDLILSDYMMPVMDGFQLLRRCKEETTTASIPFVLLTARAEPEDRLSALRIGVDDYLIKPFTTPELRLHVDALIEHLYAREDTNNSVTNEAALTRVQSKAERAWLEELESYVKMHLDNPRLKVGDLSKAFAMSESALLRQVKRLTGLTVQQYVTELRLATARRLLETGAVTNARKAGESVGYANAGSFNRRFKQRYGRLPSECLKRMPS